MSEPRYGVQVPLDVRYMPDGLWCPLHTIRYLSALTQKSYTIPGLLDSDEEPFYFDFASVPRIPVAYLLTGNTAFLASLWHDFLYKTGLEPKHIADAIFAEIMDAPHWEGGPYDERAAEPEWRKILMWTGVSLFGRDHYKGEDGEAKAGFELSSFPSSVPG